MKATGPLSSLADRSWPRVLDTSSADLVRDFFVPALSRAVRYDRAVGFFSSGWLRASAEGVANFTADGGLIRWLASPMLDNRDWLALWDGETTPRDPALRGARGRSRSDILDELKAKDRTRSALTWMVANRIITFRLAVPEGKLDGGDFHDKFGIFTDREGNRLCFSGSYNDSMQGLRNYESIKVFCSWEPGTAELAHYEAQRFERLWGNSDPNVRAFDLPEAAREQILRIRTTENFRGGTGEVEVQDSELGSTSTPDAPSIPDGFKIRGYQTEAIESWVASGYRGLFEMATGTGKTVTALAASVRLFEREERLVVVVSCPYTHLVSQWAEEVEKFGYNTVLAFGSAGPWVDKLANQLLDFSAGYINDLAILTTHDTFSSERFIDIVSGVGPVPKLLIVDEVHDVGAPKRRLGLIDGYDYRLGLSATPRRWLDKEGTGAIFDYFGQTVYEFPLSEAIPEYLTPYEYHPFFVELTASELEEYQKLSRQISARAHAASSTEQDELLKLFMILRQQIVVNADNKYRCFEEVIRSLERKDHTLVYCSPEQIDSVQRILNAVGVVQSRFTGEESLLQRKILLDSFDSGDHEMLVAMKVLDQGVDVPSTRTAILMGSSGNPKEFIQRRGRVLRRFPGKEQATIFDILVVPTINGTLDQATLEMERKILERELRRYHEFSELARNRVQAMNAIAPIKRKYRVV